MLNFIKYNQDIWARMAEVNLAIGHGDAALDLMGDGIKFEEDNLKVWNQYLQLTTYCNDPKSILHAYNGLLNVSTTIPDTSSLEALVNKLATRVENGEEVTEMREKVLDLFVRLVQVNRTDPLIWCLFAVAFAAVKEPSRFIIAQSTVLFRKAFKLIIQDRRWEENMKKSKAALSICLKAFEHILRCCPRFGLSQLTISLLLTVTQYSRFVINKMYRSNLNFNNVSNALTACVAQQGAVLETLVVALEIIKSHEAWCDFFEFLPTCSKESTVSSYVLSTVPKNLL